MLYFLSFFKNLDQHFISDFFLLQASQSGTSSSTSGGGEETCHSGVSLCRPWTRFESAYMSDVIKRHKRYLLSQVFYTIQGEVCQLVLFN